MVLDLIEQSARYEALSPGIATGLRWLRTVDTQRLNLGRHEIDGDRVFALVNGYRTKPIDTCPWEVHRRHIDIQAMIAGSERVGVAPLSRMQPKSRYDEDADRQWVSGAGDCIALTEGGFAIFFPQDAHQPEVAIDAPAAVRKVVIKVRVESEPR